jgi:HK97 family phage prohead protease
MLELQRRLFGGGNRIYWRDCDLEMIAKRFDVEARKVQAFDLAAEEATLEMVELAAAGEPSSDEFRFALSSNAVDTYGDTINQMGWDYRRFDKNPVALQFHRGSTLPIGTWSKRGIENGMLKAALRFSSDRDAKRIEHQVRERTLRMTSVGFMPGEWKWSEDPKRKYGIDFLDGHVLLEASVVSIGANPDALLEADAPGLTDKQNGLTEATPAEQPAKSFLDFAQRRMTAIRARF